MKCLIDLKQTLLNIIFILPSVNKNHLIHHLNKIKKYYRAVSVLTLVGFSLGSLVYKNPIGLIVYSEYIICVSVCVHGCLFLHVTL